MNSLPETVEHIALVVSGHTMLHKPVRLGNCVFIDTGACVNAKFVLMDVAQLFDPMLEFNSVDIIYNRFG